MSSARPPRPDAGYTWNFQAGAYAGYIKLYEADRSQVLLSRRRAGCMPAGRLAPDRRRAQSDIAAWTPGRILSEAGRFALFETAAAHKAVERGGKVGTVVVEPQC